MAPDHFQAAEARHGLVDDDRRLVIVCRTLGQAVAAVAGDVDRVARAFQALLHQAGLGRIVLHVQQPWAHASTPSGGEKRPRCR